MASKTSRSEVTQQQRPLPSSPSLRDSESTSRLIINKSCCACTALLPSEIRQWVPGYPSGYKCTHRPEVCSFQMEKPQTVTHHMTRHGSTVNVKSQLTVFISAPPQEEKKG